MKPFNLEEFKAGKIAITRSGQEASFIAYLDHPDIPEGYRLFARLVDIPQFHPRHPDGSLFRNRNDPHDLVGMKAEKKTSSNEGIVPKISTVKKEKGTQMKPFNLSSFCSGKPALTGSGKTAHFVAYFSRGEFPDFEEYERLVVRLEGVEGRGLEAIETYNPEGKYCNVGEYGGRDLITMKEQEVTQYLNVFLSMGELCSFGHPTQEAAKGQAESRDRLEVKFLHVAVPVTFNL
jgi:hypothetical protein